MRHLRKLGLFLGIVVALAAFTELSFRTLYQFRDTNVKMWEPRSVWYDFYPELQKLEKVDRDEHFEVLLLGGSTIAGESGRWGNIEKHLDIGLRALGKVPRITNLGGKPHTSRDAKLKYEFAQDKRFDVVLYYEGINESRANNIPAESFDLQYNHMTWDSQTNLLPQHPELRYLMLPFAAHWAYSILEQRYSGKTSLKRWRPPAELAKYGSEIKTAVSFKQNIKDLITLSRTKSEKLFLITYATYLPLEYTEERFQKKELDYTRKESYDTCCATELWGTPENVEKAVDAHNQILRELARPELGTAVIDVAREMPKDGKYFSDICHLSEEGSQRFAEVVVPNLLSDANRVAEYHGDNENKSSDQQASANHTH